MIELEGGSSREPFITSDIPDELPNNSIDVILRDGSLVRGAQDVSRLTQLFTTPKGLKFITNTNLLSRTSVKTEATIVSLLFKAIAPSGPNKVRLPYPDPSCAGETISSPLNLPKYAATPPPAIKAPATAPKGPKASPARAPHHSSYGNCRKF